jgi:xylogalacturonan beta-1,3-xylosyltransferase
VLFIDLCFWLLINKFLIFCGQIKRGREKIEDGLARARAAILDAARLKNYTSYKEGTYIPKGVIYRNPYAFHQLSFAINLPTNIALSITLFSYFQIVTVITLQD